MGAMAKRAGGLAGRNRTARPSRRRASAGNQERHRDGGRGFGAPVLRLLVYYALLVAAAAGLIRFLPALREAFLAPLDAGVRPGGEFSGGLGSLETALPAGGDLNRSLTTALVVTGTILLILPVAWVYTFIRHLRYDR